MGRSPSARIVVAGLLAAGMLAACGIAASGDIVSMVRQVDEFDSIDIGSGLRLELTVEAGQPQSITVNYDNNIIDRVITRVNDRTLFIEFDGSVRFSGSRSDRAVVVVMPRLVSLDAAGGASVSASGAADRLTISASGGSSVNAVGLRADDVVVDASGGASLAVFAGGSVTGEASGGSSVRVEGSPSVIQVGRSGGASVSGD